MIACIYIYICVYIYIYIYIYIYTTKFEKPAINNVQEALKIFGVDLISTDAHIGTF